MSSASSTAFSEARARLQSIGASEVAGVLGVCPFSNALSIWAAKVRGLSRPQNMAMKMGKVMEDTIARLYELETGQTLKGDGETTHVSPFWPWLHATPDRWRDDGLLVEIKNVGFTSEESRAGWGTAHTDDIPLHYRVQGQAQMAVLNCEKMDFAALLGGNEFRVYHLARDHDFCTSAVQICKDFYDRHIVGQAQPALDFAHPATLRTLSRLDTFDYSQTVTLDSAQERLLQEYLENRKAIAGLELRQEELKGNILALMGDCHAALGGACSARRKVVQRKAYEVSASTYVRLDVSQKKDKQA